MVPKLPDFLKDRGVNVEKLSVALYDFIYQAKQEKLDVYKEQELAVEESQFFFHLLTGLYFRDAFRWRMQQPDDTEEEEDPDEDE